MKIHDLCEEQKRAFVEELLSDGIAVSHRQAEQIASIALDPALTTEAKEGLFYLIRSRGEDLDLADLSADDIEEAANLAVQTARRVALSIIDPLGRA